MKKLLLLLSVAPIISFAQGICDTDASIIIFSNYDGGTLNINVDDNVPNLRIGVCSYQPVTVNLSGAYVGNVTGVVWAGFSIEGTTVNGIDASLVELQEIPAATITDPDGFPFIICGYDCDTTSLPSPCNTVEQVTHYFLSHFGGPLRYSQFQFDAWGSDYTTGDGGNCCFSNGCAADVDAGPSLSICAGDTALVVPTGADSYTWVADGQAVSCDLPCTALVVAPATTMVYGVTGTDDQGCTGFDEVTVVVNTAPDISLTLSGGVLYASGASSYTWWQDGEEIPGITGNTYAPAESGIYWATSSGLNGCVGTSETIEVLVSQISDTASAPFHVYPNPAKDFCTLTFYQPSVDRRISVRDLTGRILMQLPVPTGSSHAMIPLEHLPAQYLMVVVEEGGLSHLLPLVHE